MLSAATAQGADPLHVVRDFCSADGRGDRLSPYEWHDIAPLLAWRLEPAWDRVVLMQGYEISTPRRTDDRVEVDVTYTVTGEVVPGKVDRRMENGKRARLETVTLTLVPDGDGGWLVGGAPPAPHVFETSVEPETLAELLQPGTGYTSNSAAVWGRLGAAGWDIPYTSTAAISESPHFVEVGTADPGDLVVYYAHGAPYHVGWIEADDAVWSSSLNAGSVVTSLSAFAGATRYWRPRRFDAGAPEPTPSRPSLRRR